MSVIVGDLESCGPRACVELVSLGVVWSSLLFPVFVDLGCLSVCGWCLCGSRGPVFLANDLGWSWGDLVLGWF